MRKEKDVKQKKKYTLTRAEERAIAKENRRAMKHYEALKARGVLIRCWDDPALREHVRITIGTREQMRRLVLETRAILSERTIS